jgi:uncharacterized phage protein (TIGR02218 family)
MRESDNFSEKHEKLLNSKRDVSFAYIYEIFLLSGNILRLNSSGFDIVVDGKRFLRFSSINLEKGDFDDSGENVIILRGIFEAAGVDKKMDLAGSQIKIYHYLDGTLKPLVNYFITEFTKSDLDFILKCEPETIKYNQSLLLLYSKTCRANFGDSKCGVDTNQYKKSYKIKSIKPHIITLLNMDFNSGYYNLGQVLFLNETGTIISFKITSHHNDQIVLDKEVYEDLFRQEQVSLLPTCDKNFRTCCNKFDNAVNFRGEPTIAEHNFLKNHV